MGHPSFILSLSKSDAQPGGGPSTSRRPYDGRVHGREVGIGSVLGFHHTTVNIVEVISMYLGSFSSVTLRFESI